MHAAEWVWDVLPTVQSRNSLQCGIRGWHLDGMAMRAQSTAVRSGRSVCATQACVHRRKKKLCAPACENIARVICAHHEHPKMALCATSSFMLGEVLCLCQAKNFHEPNASSADIFVGDVVKSLHLHLCRPHLRPPDQDAPQDPDTHDNSQDPENSDSGWAECRRETRSTSGGVLARGQHCLISWSNTHKIVTLSFAEADLTAAVRAAEGTGRREWQ